MAATMLVVTFGYGLLLQDKVFSLTFLPTTIGYYAYFLLEGFSLPFLVPPFFLDLSPGLGIVEEHSSSGFRTRTLMSQREKSQSLWIM